MSREDWEHGTITLPSSAVAPLKKAVRDEANRLHDGVRAFCDRWWKANQTRSHRVYDDAVEDLGKTLRVNPPLGRQPDTVTLLSAEVLHRVGAQRRREGRPPRKPTVEDVNRVAPRYTNRDTTFPLDTPEAAIEFRGRTVIWRVDRNNHAVERARSHPLATVLFRELNRVAWTRGTGGEIVGNDEYHMDSVRAGGGANYVTDRFGPNVARDRRRALVW